MSEKTLLSKGNIAAITALIAAISATGWFGAPVVEGWAAAVTDNAMKLALHELRDLKAEKRELERAIRRDSDDEYAHDDLAEVEDEIADKLRYIKCLEEKTAGDCSE